jgi:hypothetical protein
MSTAKSYWSNHRARAAQQRQPDHPDVVRRMRELQAERMAKASAEALAKAGLPERAPAVLPNLRRGR